MPEIQFVGGPQHGESMCVPRDEYVHEFLEPEELNISDIYKDLPEFPKPIKAKRHRYLNTGVKTTVAGRKRIIFAYEGKY